MHNCCITRKTQEKCGFDGPGIMMALVGQMSG